MELAGQSPGSIPDLLLVLIHTSAHRIAHKSLPRHWLFPARAGKGKFSDIVKAPRRVRGFYFGGMGAASNREAESMVRESGL